LIPKPMIRHSTEYVAYFIGSPILVKTYNCHFIFLK